MSDIWFTADTHYGHKNICKGVSDWKDLENCRNFSTIEEMNQAIVDNINNNVKINDILYHLGDWNMGNNSNTLEFYNKLNCENIYLIPGNHDKYIIKTFMDLNIRFKEVLPNIHNIKINDYLFILSHYPINSWENKELGSIHLHGHTHHKLDSSFENTNLKRMDVGVDWEEFRPFHIEEILEIMKHRKNN